MLAKSEPPENVQRFTEDALAFERSVSVGGVKERHVMIVGAADDVDHLGEG